MTSPVGDLVDMVGELLGKHLEVESDPERVCSEKSELERLVSTPQLARERLGWEPEVELREGLARTIAWMERDTTRYQADHYVICGGLPAVVHAPPARIEMAGALRHADGPFTLAACRW